MTDVAARLARRGVTVRPPHVSDRRRYPLRLTAVGLAEVGRRPPLVAETSARLANRLSTTTLDSLRILLKRILSS